MTTATTHEHPCSRCGAPVECDPVFATRDEDTGRAVCTLAPSDVCCAACARTFGLPGIYQMPAAAYHADPCPEPSLSSSIAKKLCTDSPLHAWTAHPRLNAAAVKEEADRFDIGTVAHAILLEGADIVTVVDAPDWKTKAAREQRDAARAAGKVPLLVGKLEDVERMVKAAAEQLRPFRSLHLFDRGLGRAEQTLIWQEEDVWCRARLDWLHDDHRAIGDYKSTSATANPEVLSRTLFNHGWDVQAAWYIRGLRAINDEPDAEIVFRFVVQETYPPYALSVIALGPDAMLIGEKKCLFALERWRECRLAQKWPGYPTRVCYASLPAWEESRWLEKEFPDGV